MVTDRNRLNDALAVDEESCGDGLNVGIGRRQIFGGSDGIVHPLFLDEFPQRFRVLIRNADDGQIIP